MSKLPVDYDSDPERWANRDRSTQVFGDVDEGVAERISLEMATPTLDIGGGQDVSQLSFRRAGRRSSLTAHRHNRDRVPSQAQGRRHEALFRDGVAGSVAMLWMLYHLDDPVHAIGEAKRVRGREDCCSPVPPVAGTIPS